MADREWWFFDIHSEIEPAFHDIENHRYHHEMKDL